MTRTTDTRYPLATAIFLASTTYYLCLMAFGHVGPLGRLEQVVVAALAGMHALGVVVMLTVWLRQWRVRRRLGERVEMMDHRWPVEGGDVRGGGRNGGGERAN